MTVRRRDRGRDTSRFAAGTSWQSGRYRIDISTGVFTSERAAAAYADGSRGILVSGDSVVLARFEGPDVVVQYEQCLGYDVDLLLRDHSLADAALPWRDMLKLLASGQSFACVGRAVLWVAPDVLPTTEEWRAGATDLEHVQCGQNAN